MKTTLLTLLLPIVLFGQIQIGQEIDGTAQFDTSGYNVSVSSDGSIIAIGAPSHDNNSGQVRVYENVAGDWSQIGQDIDGFGQAGNTGLGWSLSLSDDGNTVAAGGVSGAVPSLSGHVRVYENAGGVWTQIGNDIEGEAPSDFSGWSMSLSGDASTVAIGAPENDGNGNKSGHVRMYENVGGVWTQIGEDIDGEAAEDQSGYSVSISNDGSIVAIGAIYNADNGSFLGQVRVYENVSGVWTQVGEDINGETFGGQFGKSVSLSDDGTIVAIGADAYNSFAGQVQVYENLNGAWTQIGNDIVGEAGGDQIGSSVSLSSNGDVIAIGAMGGNNGSGHVSIYKYELGTWAQAGSNINGEAGGDQYGRSVSISSDGTTVIIGAPFNDGNGNASGHARVFDLSGVLSINDFSIENTIVIHPNPVSETVAVKLNQNSTVEKIIIYNNLGQIVKEDTNTTINISALSIGTYYMEITTNNGITTKKLIKK